MASLSGNLATMGCAVPYAIAAKFAYPDRTVIAFAGDGAMQMNGNVELLTISKYWKSWSKPNIIICVLNNHDLNMVTWEQRMMEGDPKLDTTQVTPDFDSALALYCLAGCIRGRLYHTAGRMAKYSIQDKDRMKYLKNVLAKLSFNG